MKQVELTGTKAIDDIIYNYKYYAEHADKYCKVMHQLKMRTVFAEMKHEMCPWTSTKFYWIY